MKNTGLIGGLTVIDGDFFFFAAARKKKQAKPLSFKVGIGRVIRGVSVFSSSESYFSGPRYCFYTHSCMHLQWDEGLLTMSKGETARLEIEPEWAYGKKGVPDNKYPFRAQILLKYSFTNFYRTGCSHIFISSS